MVHEAVSVERVVLTGRVVDRFAAPIPGLTASDFRLLVDGTPTAIESAEWIAPQAETGRRAVSAGTVESIESGLKVVPPTEARRPSLSGASRTVVLLFQWEIAGQKDEGFVRMMNQARRFIQAGDSEDRMAVLAFGSSLHLIQDFTHDQVALLDAVEGVRNPSYRGRPAATDGPTLSLPLTKCGPTGAIQKAMVCIGDSLQTVPGPKTLMFFGWTVGRARSRVRNDHYPEMIEAVGKSQTSVFVFDVSSGSHTLAAGIAQLAFDTGGLYNGGVMDFYSFPDLARIRVRQALEGGTYELVFRNPITQRGWHRVEIELAGRKGIPLFQRWYRD